MASRAEVGSTPQLGLYDTYAYKNNQRVVRFQVEWTSRTYGIICDLDLHVYCYDERARFIEKLDSGNKRTKDQSCVLVSDTDGATGQSNTFSENVKIDFRLVHKDTSAIMLFLDGGPRNFQFVQTVTVTCEPVAARSVIPGQAPPAAIFQFTEKTRKDFQGIALAVVYRDGWLPIPEEVMDSIFEPVFVSSQKAKSERILFFVVTNVPSLEKFRPRLFANVNDLCAALSSEALPGLKDKFTAMASGLPITPFTEVIFRQLYKTHPKICDPNERAYTVAMIQEMFQQIDYNGDGSADWDEFTTFCIQTASDGKGVGVGGSSIDEYVIEYEEDSAKRDRVLSPYRPVALMKFVPHTKRFLVVPDEADRIIMLDEKFQARSSISPYNITEDDGGRQSAGVEPRKIVVYDVCYLAGKDLYAFSCSDHTITVCKEQGGIGNRPGAHILYSRLYHGLLHVKLCWSERNQILCSVANNRVIYGWDIDKTLPIFQVSRHSDIVTDFIACDVLDTFITCGMDRRIVMWSAHTRRVKAIFTGHRRGLRCISAYDTTLLSAGFETDARTWDLSTKENIAILKGHRFAIADAKLMCELAQNEKEYRAVTVDESGELRLWNIYVKEKASDAVFVPTLQVFHMHHPSVPMSNIRYIAIPNDVNLSTSYYSNLVAVGTKMLHFVPEKNTKEFVPPSGCVFNEAAAELCTLVGKSMFKYDVCKGAFTSMVDDCHTADVTAIVLDGPRGRRCFIGCGNGDLLLVNYMSGGVIDKVSAHKKEINCILSIQGQRNTVFSGSADGSIVVSEEHKGDLHVHSCIENAFGEGVGVTDVKVASSINILVAASAGTSWGLWHSHTCKRVALFNEANHGGPVSRIEVLGCSRDEDDIRYLDANFGKIRKSDLAKREKEKLLTVAVGTPLGIHVYTMDVTDMRGVNSYCLVYERPIYINQLTPLHYPSGDSVNYAGVESKSDTHVDKSEFSAGSLTLICVTDEGGVVAWNIHDVRMESETKFRKRYPTAAKKKKKKKTGTSSSERPVDTANSRYDTADTRNSDLDDEEMKPLERIGSKLENDQGIEDSSQVVASVASVGIVTEYESQNFFVTDTYAKHIHERFESGGGVGSPPADWYDDYDAHPTLLEKIRCGAQFRAHLDSATVLVPMHEHGCFATCSHDGFHRIWNLDGACLGELPMPNLTDKLKVQQQQQFINQWKFIQERIAITRTHHDLAERLVGLVQNKKTEKVKPLKRDFRMSILSKGGLAKSELANLKSVQNLKPSTHQVADLDLQQQERLEKEGLRTRSLEAMNEKIGPREDGPPLSIPTKDEIKLMELTDRLSNTTIRRDKKDIYGFDEATGRLGSPGSPVNEQDDSGFIDDTKPFFLTKMFDATNSDTDSASLYPSEDSIAKNEGVIPKVAVSPIKPQKIKNFGSRNAMWSIAGDEKGEHANKMRVAKAFTEESLVQSMNEGIIDEESFGLLKSFSGNRSNVSQYMNSTKGTILLRNPTLSTSIELPAIEDMRRAEIAFGPQKDYYRNAELVLTDRDNLNKDKMRNAITLGRIEHNVKKIGSMMHLMNPMQVDEVKIPLDNKAQEYRLKMASEDKRMQVRLLESATLVPVNIDDTDETCTDNTLIQKVDYRKLNKFRSLNVLRSAQAEVRAAEAEKEARMGWDYEAPKELKIDKRHQNNIEFLNQLGNKRRPLDKSGLERLQSKITEATHLKHHEEFDQRYAYNSSGLGTVVLDTRSLLPFYKAEDVRHFMDIFVKVDEDFSGDLDMNEWVKLFSSINHTIPEQESRSIFMKFKNEKGVLTVNELVPVVFSKATKDQMKLITKFCLAEIMRPSNERTVLSFADVDQLFEIFDIENVGFVAVGFIRDKAREWPLHDNIVQNFLNTIKEIDDDEMVNHREFQRMFKHLVGQAEIKAQREEELRADRDAKSKRKR
eukprot:GSChrysophyteH1.ASY1.ANO1.74.1 assembled CDS